MNSLFNYSFVLSMTEIKQINKKMCYDLKLWGLLLEVRSTRRLLFITASGADRLSRTRGSPIFIKRTLLCNIISNKSLSIKEKMNALYNNTWTGFREV